MCHFEHLSALKFFNGCVTMYCVSLRGNPICFESALNGCWHAFFHMLKKPNYITLYASIPTAPLLQGWRLQSSRDKFDGRLFPASGGVMQCKTIDKEKGVVEEYTTYYPQPALQLWRSTTVHVCVCVW